MRERSYVTFQTLTTVSVAIGVAIRIGQYANNGSLWLDEIAVAKNIIERSLVDLITRPLDYQQAAPKGFLAIEKVATLLGGTGDHVLRLWPFLASTAALLLFWRLASRVLEPAGTFVAVASTATAVSLIRQTSEVKQYGTDVFVAILLVSFASNARRDRRFDLLAGVVGAVMIWFSQPAVIVAGCLVLMLVWQRWAEPPDASIAWRCGLWATSAAGATLVTLRSLTPEANDYLHRYWVSGFPPKSWAEWWSTAWPWAPLADLFGSGGGGFSTALGYIWPSLWAGLALIGLALLVRRTGRVGLMVALPVVATVAAAVLHQFPFRDRAILFLVPMLLLGIGEVGSLVFRRLANISLPLAGLAVATITAGTLYPVLRVHPPYTTEDVHPIMAAIAADRGNRPAIFLHYNAAVAFDYYASLYGFAPADYSIAKCQVAAPTDMLRDVDEALRGRSRAWVVFVHVTALVAQERTDLLGYLDTIGRRLTTMTVANRRAVGAPLDSQAVLYDFSDPTRLAMADAASFPLKTRFNRGPNCHEGPQAMSVPRLLTGSRATGTEAAPLTRSREGLDGQIPKGGR